jgi:hypothetical protein
VQTRFFSARKKAKTMSKTIELLQDITAATRGARSGLSTKGRMKRHPDFSAPRISSSRPKSDIGITFHFAHKTISKRNDISESQRDATSAPSHQSYIERLEAVEISSFNQIKIALESNLLTSHANSKFENFPYPELALEPGRDSFGTNGRTKADRVEFWRGIESNEGRTSRVQSRVIAELPHETSQEDRLKIAMQFCLEFHKERLPYWATIHSPNKNNDARNYHLHIAYYDRPSGRDENGRWDFATIETRKKKNRTRVETRPYKQKKTDTTRDRGWVKFLRKKFAEANNQVLSQGGYAKRLDYRSYGESGVRKKPTEHLGFKSSAAEKFGLETTRGKRNSRREFQWQIEVATRRWDERIVEHDTFLLFNSNLNDEQSWIEEKKSKAMLQEGRSQALLSAKYRILSEVLTGRISARTEFLSQERTRLSTNKRFRVSPESQQSLSLIDIETGIIDTRLPEISQIAEKCQAKSDHLRESSEDTWLNFSSFNSRVEQPTTEVIFDNNINYPIDDIFKADEDTTNDIETANISSNIDDIFGSDEVEKATLDSTITPDSKVVNSSHVDRDYPTIPGTLLIPDMSSRAEIRALNERLIGMTNREVRMRAIASRDAAEFLDSGIEKSHALRGWAVLRLESDKRGINLATGRQDLTKASDRERAELHRDETLGSILEVREEVIRIMSR